MKKFYVLLAMMFTIVISKAQIPNSGFENWSTKNGYSNPVDWDNFNDMTSQMSIITCEKGLNPNSSSYLKLTSKTVPGFGVIPGLAVCGAFDLNTMSPSSGFAYTKRPTSLSGICRHNEANGFVEIRLTKWDQNSNTRIIISNSIYPFSGKTSGWTKFSIPMNYINSTSPDSCIILISASDDSPTNGDYLYLDDLNFNEVTAVDDENFNSNITVYPNPATDFIQPSILSQLNDSSNFQIMDINGRIIQTSVQLSNQINKIDVSTLTPGLYLIKVIALDKQYYGSFIKR